MPGVPHAGAWRTKRRIFTTNYEPKSPVRHASDRSDEKTVIVRGALKGKVTAVKTGATTSHIAIDIGGGITVTASITN